MSMKLRDCVGIVLAMCLLMCAFGCEVRDNRDSCPPGGCNPYRPIVVPTRPYYPRPRPYQPRTPYRPHVPHRSIELVDLPESDRQPNWRDADGSGSCCFASLVAALRAQNQHELASHVEANYAGGCWSSSLIEACDQIGIDYAVTTEGDAELLAWADRTQRAGVIFFYPNHAVTFMGFTSSGDGQEYAVLLDNNRVSEYRYEPKQEFLHRWQTEFGGFAIFPVHTPIPPTPVR